jgi:hypothetical protein
MATAQLTAEQRLEECKLVLAQRWLELPPDVQDYLLTLTRLANEGEVAMEWHLRRFDARLAWLRARLAQEDVPPDLAWRVTDVASAAHEDVSAVSRAALDAHWQRVHENFDRFYAEALARQAVRTARIRQSWRGALDERIPRRGSPRTARARRRAQRSAAGAGRDPDEPDGSRLGPRSRGGRLGVLAWKAT